MSWRFGLLLGWAALIFAGSSIPGNALPDIGTTDWVFHFLEYMVLGGLAFNWLIPRDPFPPLPALAAWLGSVSYGGFDEIHQQWVPGRDSSLRDMGFDALGALAGVILAVVIYLWLQSRSRRRRGGG